MNKTRFVNHLARSPSKFGEGSPRVLEYAMVVWLVCVTCVCALLHTGKQTNRNISTVAAALAAAGSVR